MRCATCWAPVKWKFGYDWYRCDNGHLVTGQLYGAWKATFPRTAGRVIGPSVLHPTLGRYVEKSKPRQTDLQSVTSC